MKKILTILCILFLFAISIFGQWTDVEKVLNGPTLAGINTSYPSVGNEALFGGNFSGTTDGSISSQRVIKYNSSTGTFSSVTGLSAGDVIKGFFVGPDGLIRAYGKFASAGEYFGVCKFNSTNTTVSFETVFQFTGPNASTQQVDAGWSGGGKVLIYGANFSQMNGVSLSGSHSVALVNGITVTNQSGLVPSISGETPSIQNIRYDGEWILLGNFSALGNTNALDLARWNEISITTINASGGANSYCRDFEAGYIGWSGVTTGSITSPGGLGLSGTTLSGLSDGWYVKTQDIEFYNSKTWFCGPLLSTSAPNRSRIASWNGTTWVNEEGALINAPYANATNVTMYGMVAFPNCIIVYGNFLPPVSHCTFMAKQCVAPLPIKLGFFKGEKTTEGNKLYWQTHSEINNSGFEIQHFTPNGKGEYNFETINFVSGTGNSANLNNYSFLDKNPKKDINYYRLKQVDYDGNFSFSNIVQIRNDLNNKKKEISIYPTTTSGKINIEFNPEYITEISIIDISGKNIFYQKIENKQINQITVDLFDQAAGTYTVNIGNEKIKIAKM